MAFYEEIKVLHQQLDVYKNGSMVDRKQFLNLHGGSGWGRNFKNSGYQYLRNTSFPHAGCMQPALVSEMLNRDDHDGFNDR